MRRNILNKIGIVLALAVLVSACKAKKEIVQPPVTVPVTPAPPATNHAAKLSAISGANLVFNSLTIKAKADLDIDGKSNDVGMSIRIKKDQIIWISVTAIAGLEVARAIITPDSVKILNRLESTYIRKPFSYIYSFTNEQVTFKTVQDILIGNSTGEFVTNPGAQIVTQGNQTTIKGSLKGLEYFLRFNESNKLNQTNLKDNAASQNLTVNYGNFLAIGNMLAPQIVNVQSAAGQKNIKIDLEYARIGLNEAQDYPFTVPKRFTEKK